MFEHLGGMHHALCTVLFVLCTILTGCVNDDILTPEKPDSDINMDPIEGYSLGFAVSLDKDMSTREGSIEDYDNYIDTKNKFRVLFFTEEGKFLFGAVDRTVTYLTDMSDYTKDTWYVRVPMNYLIDRNGNEYDAEKIRNYLRDNSFKVAVLANWPNEGAFSSDKNDDEEGDPNITYINREPNWGFEESIYGPNEGSGAKTIHDLHHLVTDANYSDTEQSSGRPSKKDCYGDFMLNDQMGVKTDWVQWNTPSILSESGEDGRAQADSWIRKYWNPETKKSTSGEDLDQHYDELWQLWDFDASSRSNSNSNYYPYNETWSNIGNKWSREWYNKNGSSLKDGDFVNTNWYSSPDQITLGDIGLVYVPSSSSNSLEWVTKDGHKGIKLTRADNINSTNADAPYITTSSNNTKGYIKFKAPGTGTLKIKYCSNDGSNARIVVQRNTNYNSKYKTSNQTPTDITSNSNSVIGQNISITGEPEDVYIFCDTGTAVIFAIEWISSKYLYDTDRRGIAPSEENPIPMYGVQQFSALTDWEEGTTFDITTTTDSYTGKPIYLIRSLAKVVVYLPQQASYIYMRSMNRTARCEPIDVSTPTNETWKSNHDDCEFWNIKDHGSGFLETPKVTTNDQTLELSDYKNWLSWFYYSWNGNSWGNKTWSFNPSSKSNPPHIFNSDINRSDFCQMLYDRPTEQGYKYVLYVPEKNVTDPNYPGISSSIAKVCHIEYRYNYATMSQGESFEDNNCNRIYFTDYSANDDIKKVESDKYESEYEKSKSNLDNHWPIMRNHVYEFVVSGTKPANITVQAKVKDWGYERKVVEW